MKAESASFFSNGANEYFADIQQCGIFSVTTATRREPQRTCSWLCSNKTLLTKICCELHLTHECNLPAPHVQNILFIAIEKKNIHVLFLTSVHIFTLHLDDKCIPVNFIGNNFINLSGQGNL